MLRRVSKTILPVARIAVQLENVKTVDAWVVAATLALNAKCSMLLAALVVSKLRFLSALLPENLYIAAIASNPIDKLLLDYLTGRIIPACFYFYVIYLLVLQKLRSN
jgi:hypothetical protein